MKALELRAYDGVSLVFVSNRPVPRPAYGEVLVRVYAAPITQADLQFLQGKHGEMRPLPAVPGLECSGTVVQSGGGLLARALVGRRVTCRASEYGDGTWAEYVCVPARRCVPLRSFTSLEQGALMLQTGLRAYALLEMARAAGARAVAHTAGDSPLGRMLMHLAQRRKLPVLHLARNPIDVAALRQAGARHVVDLATGPSAAQLQALFAALGVNVVVEASTGEQTDALLKALPRGGSVLCCGTQPDAECTIDPAELIYGAKTLAGFSLRDWMQQAGFPRLLQAGLQVQRLLYEEPHADLRPVSARLALDSYHQAFDILYRGRNQGGQVLFRLYRSN